MWAAFCKAQNAYFTSIIKFWWYWKTIIFLWKLKKTLMKNRKNFIAETQSKSRFWYIKYQEFTDGYIETNL